MSKQRIIVVGGGLAGLAASMKVAELGMSTDIPSSATFMDAASPANPPPTTITRCLLINIDLVTRLLLKHKKCLQLKK